jgi:hypothetical protein
MSMWMMEEGALDPELAFIGEVGVKRRITGRKPEEYTAEHNLSVFLKPLVINNTRKWFGEADIRVDALVTQGGMESGSLYAPRTFHFPRVADRDDLANAENGLMIYYGKPKHFLVLTLLLARDTEDSDDLAALIEKQANREDVSSVLGSVAAAVASPHVAAVQTAMKAALLLGDVAYNLVRQISPKCLGLYRANWLAQKDNFGIGRHPAEGSLEIKDFSFAYSVVQDKQDP